MMRALSIPAAIVLALTCMVARAQPPHARIVGAPDPGDAKAGDTARDWFGQPPGKAKGYACFERIYDAAHLAKHPLQRVGSMLLLVRGEMIAEDPLANYSVALRMTYKNTHARFVSSGYCGHAGAGGLRCGIDCDGGSLGVELAPDAKSALLSLERIAIWPDNANTAADDRRTHLDAGADDKAFRLQRLPAARCAPLANPDETAEIGRAK